MDLGLPPAPGQGAARDRSGRERTVIIVAASVLTLGGLGCCLAFSGFYGFALEQSAQMESRRVEAIFVALEHSDYESAAKACGRGVTARQLEEAVESHLGAPLTKHEMVPRSVKMRVDAAQDSAGICVTYDLVGSRTKARVEVVFEDSPGQTVAIPAWGIRPETGGVQRVGSESGAASASDATGRLPAEKP